MGMIKGFYAPQNLPVRIELSPWWHDVGEWFFLHTVAGDVFYQVRDRPVSVDMLVLIANGLDEMRSTAGWSSFPEPPLGWLLTSYVIEDSIGSFSKSLRVAAPNFQRAVPHGPSSRQPCRTVVGNGRYRPALVSRYRRVERCGSCLGSPKKLHGYRPGRNEGRGYPHPINRVYVPRPACSTV